MRCAGTVVVRQVVLVRVGQLGEFCIWQRWCVVRTKLVCNRRERPKRIDGKGMIYQYGREMKKVCAVFLCSAKRRINVQRD